MSEEKKNRLTHTYCFMFSGKAGVGKSFCSDFAQTILKVRGFNTFKTPLAYAVKETAKFMGWNGNKDVGGRRLLQSIGKAGREYDINMWVKKALGRVENEDRYPFDMIFIDDWRFKNEVKFILDNAPLYKPITIRVVAPDREILKGTPEYDDISETELDDFKFDLYLQNYKGVYPTIEEQIYNLISFGIKI
jgi:hypothetical protein